MASSREEVPRKRTKLLCNGNNNLLSSDAVICSSSSSSSSTSTDKTFRFNDSVTADVKLHLHLYDDESNTDVYLNDVYLYLHSDVLRRRSKYFSALLSYRWQRQDKQGGGVLFNLTHKVPASMKSIDTHRTVIELFYSTDANNSFSDTINTVSTALSIIHVAMEFMFEDCVKACIQFIQALPWTEEEEEWILDYLIPLLKEEDYSQELLYRVSPVKIDSSNEMLLSLIKELIHNPHQKDLVAMMLRDFSSKDSVGLAFDQAFEMTLSERRLLKTNIWWVPKEKEKIVRSSSQMRKISSTIWEKEEEKTVAHCGAYLCWLVDRMIEWEVAHTSTLEKWIDQKGSLSENLQKVCFDNIISPEFFYNVILCTWKFADAVATGSIVADTQVRIKLLKVWLPVVLNVKDMVLQFLPKDNLSFDEPFIKIISTMSESQELLLKCLGFRTHNVNDCPHFVSVYKSWFRRATTQPPKDKQLPNEETPQNVVNHQQLTDFSAQVKKDSSDEMLLRLIEELKHNPHQKDLVAMMLRDFSSRDSVRLALDQAFEMTLKSLKEVCSSKVLKYTTQAFWVPKEEEKVCSSDQMRETSSMWEEEEEEKTVVHCGGYLCWLVDRMIEWRVAHTTTLDKWIDLARVCSYNEIKPRFFYNEILPGFFYNEILPGFFYNVILCTWKLANAVATGSIVADRQVRIKLIKEWLPVVLSVKDMVLQFLPKDNHCFEEPFIKIISTLPMSESQELLLQCLGFRTHNVKDCPHLVSAYKSWFRRATTQPPKDRDNALPRPAHECDDDDLLFHRRMMIPID